MKKALRFLPLCAFPLFILKLVLLFLLPLFFVGCSDKDEEKDLIEATFLNVSDDLLEFWDEGGTRELEIESDGSWMFVSKDSWLPSEIKGVGNAKISIDAQPNTKKERREATVKVVALNPKGRLGRDLTAEIKIIQAGSGVEDINKKDFYISEKAGERTFSIQSNDNFEIESLSRWMKITDKTKQGSCTSFKVEVEANLGDQRKGQFKVKYSNNTEILLDVFQWSPTSVYINQIEGGNLRHTFALAGESDAEEITIAGKVDELDVRFLSDIVESLTLLDMGEAEAQFEKLYTRFGYKDAVDGRQCKLILPQGIKEIGSLAFTKSSLYNDIVIPKSVTVVGGHAFWETTIEKIDWSNTNITTLHDGVFRRATSKEIILPKNLKQIGSSAFAGCANIKKIDIPKSVNEIGILVFAECTALEELILPSGIEKIDRMLFDNNSLKLVSIPSSVKQIRMIYQRKDLDNQLDKLIIEGAPVLQEAAFDNVTIKELVLKSSTPPSIDEESLLAAPFNLTNVKKVIIPTGSLAAYKVAPVWEDYTNYEEQ